MRIVVGSAMQLASSPPTRERKKRERERNSRVERKGEGRADLRVKSWLKLKISPTEREKGRRFGMYS